MTRHDLIELLSRRFPLLRIEDTEVSVRMLLDALTNALAAGRRIEIRGFGSFQVKRVPAHQGRNPKSGAAVAVPAKRRVQFKAGLPLRDAVEQAAPRPAAED